MLVHNLLFHFPAALGLPVVKPVSILPGLVHCLLVELGHIRGRGRRGRGRLLSSSRLNVESIPVHLVWREVACSTTEIQGNVGNLHDFAEELLLVENVRFLAGFEVPKLTDHFRFQVFIEEFFCHSSREELERPGLVTFEKG